MVVPKRAAACIIRNDRGEILMGLRNSSLRFMADHHVFPGGRIDAADADHRVINEPDEDLAIAIFAAAREVFEETGLVCAEGAIPEYADMREYRLSLLERETSNEAFTRMLDAFDLTINSDHFEAAGHWITPEISPIRFDTNYFLYHFRGNQQEELIEGELVALDWLHPVEARKQWHKKIIDL